MLSVVAAAAALAGSSTPLPPLSCFCESVGGIYNSIIWRSIDRLIDGLINSVSGGVGELFGAREPLLSGS